MAIHWQHIKGANGANALQTYITFSDDAIETPTINVGTTAFGHILTDDYAHTVYKHFVFEDGATIKQDKVLTVNTINSNSDSGNIHFITSNTGSAIEMSSSELHSYVDVQFDKKLTVQEGIKTSGKCEALYFNATSDRRLKTNIKPFDKNALDIVKSLQTYTFDYTVGSHERSYGVMAQDLIHINLNGFSFVDEEVDGFLSVRETKLVYLLLEAVKEQQKEIETLKTEIEHMKKPQD